MTSLPCAAVDWPEFSALLDAALDLPEAERAAWLQALPPAALHLRPALARVLAQDGPTTPRLELPATLLGSETVGEPEFSPEQVLGPWRLVRRLGQGGMGEVWLAERCDGAYQRQVALKLPHALALLGQGRRRFAQERDILAALQHPHIAQFYDAGTAELHGGELQPWLALEYVPGLNISAHCQARALAPRERLRLMQQVMAAVQHAHGCLLVHRDLKPSNLMVTEHGEVKLLDFGIAKLLRPEPALGEPSRLLLATPAYAAPEQVQGGPISVATDVYALGAVLQELLCGRPPVPGSAGPLLASESVQPGHAEHCGLSRQRLQRWLRGDIDALLAKALAREPAQRYGSVQAFSDDIGRHLAGLPLQARRISWLARQLKAARRHWLLLTAAGAVSLSLGLGLASSWWQAREAAEQARRAEAIKTYLLELFKTLDPRQADAQDPAAGMRRLLQQQMAQIEQRLPSDPELAEELLRLSATVAVYLSDEARSLELAGLRWRLLKQRLGAAQASSTEAGLSLFWALWSADQREAAARVLGELDTQLPATGLLRAEWTLARHDVLVERGAAASERSAVLQQALRLYAEAAPQDSGRIAALSHWAAFQLQAGDANAALLTVDQALALLPKAEPYIALDHARLLALRAQVRSALQQASSGPREDLDQAVVLLRGSIGLRNPLAWAVVAQRLQLGCATPAGPLQAQAWAQAERLWREAWPEPVLSGVSSNASMMDGRAALLRSAVAACAWSAAAGPPLKP